MSFGGLSAGPIVAADYARAKVDGYTETGDPALTLNVSSQSLKAFTGQQTSAPVIVNSWAVPGRKQTYARLSGGANANLTGGLSVDAFVSTTLGRDQGQEVSGQLGLKAKF